MKIRSIVLRYSLILIIILFCLIPQSSVLAATLIVDTNSDVIDANGGSCLGMDMGDLPGNDNHTSLREAICVANDAPGPETITFAGSYTITLTGSQLPSITSEITITGNGQAKTIIQASSCNPVTLPGGCTPANYQVLQVDGIGSLNLTDLTIRYGETGISNSGTLSIERCSISDNSPSSGVINSGLIRSISDSSISGNRSRFHHGENGGGIRNYGTITTISKTTFSGNSAYNYGGGIFNDDPTGSIGTIFRCTFSNNHAGFGGGIYNRNSIGVIDNSIFVENDANHQGGGIINNGTIDNITNSTLRDNDSRLGGGLFNHRLISTISHNTFDGNHAVEGGAIYNNDFDTINTIVNSTFSGNSASDYGGGIYNKGTINTINNSTLYGNWSDDNVGNGILNQSTIDTISNTLIAYSIGDHCQGPSPSNNINNLTDANDCWNWPNSLIYNLHIGPLADNGGLTKTHALLLTAPANPAINTGPASCSGAPVNDEDQRSVTRSTFSPCDIGAFEYTDFDFTLTVSASNPPNSSSLQNLSKITVSFNKDVVSDGGANAANNPDNFLLVEKGTNAYFDTQSCLSGLMADDSQITVQSAVYDDTSWTTTLTLNPAPLPNGKYRLFVCGTTSIYDLIGLELNNGINDTLINFSVGAAAKTLPDTGFIPGQITMLSKQPSEKAYSSYSDLWLEIPHLDLRTDIVGVPIMDGEWNVSWLGNKVGYLTGTAFPTWAGNTVITAHVWDAWNQPGPFANLKSLQHGNQFYIHAFGQVYTYEVRSNLRVHPDNMNVIGHSDYDLITLLTCERWNLFTGDYHYRRVVKAVLVNVSPE